MAHVSDYFQCRVLCKKESEVQFDGARYVVCMWFRWSQARDLVSGVNAEC